MGERHHREGHRGWVTATPPEEVWKRSGVAEQLRPGAVVLNIGVGGGAEARDLAGRGCVVHVLDLSVGGLDSP